MKTKTISVEKKLTEAEINERAHEMAEKVFNKLTKQFEKKTAMSMFKADIDALDEKINKLSETINRGTEYQDVECTYEDDHVLNLRTYYNRISGAVESVVPIPGTEQDTLPFDNENRIIDAVDEFIERNKDYDISADRSTNTITFTEKYVEPDEGIPGDMIDDDEDEEDA